MTRTKVVKVAIDGQEYPMIWDISCAMDFGEAMGVDGINEIQQMLMTALQSFAPDENGNIKISSIKVLGVIVHTALVAGAEHTGAKCGFTLREVRNVLLSAEGVEIIKGLVECFAQYMPEQKEETEEVGKQMATA